MNLKHPEFIPSSEIDTRIIKNEIVFLKGKKFDTLVGKNLRLKINCSVGLSSIYDFKSESDKIIQISKFDVLPDIMMDLSIIPSEVPLYHLIQKEVGCPVGTVPIYTCFDSKTGIDKNKLLEEIEKQAQNGVSFMTFHFTATENLHKQSLSRNIPVISRGGSLALRDLYINRRNQNILLEYFDEICDLLKKYSVVASIGTTFRPSSLFDALDKTQLEEIKLQKEIIKRLQQKKINVMLEGIGHISLTDLKKYISLIRKDGYIPFMPLGPIPTDRAIGWDHVSSAIGASHMAFEGGADIINSVTREEHTGGIPSLNSIYEAIKSAHVVVETINDIRFFDYFNKPQNKKFLNCLGTINNTVGCNRCQEECPFLLNNMFYNKIF